MRTTPTPSPETLPGFVVVSRADYLARTEEYLRRSEDGTVVVVEENGKRILTITCPSLTDDELNELQR